MNPLKHTNGFSLLELVIYVAVVSIVATVLVNFAIDVTTMARKAKARLDVQQNARFAMDRMLAETRSAQGVNTGDSTFGSHPGVLSLQKSDSSRDPTVFDVNNGILRISEGGNAPEDLTPAKLDVSNLVFKNLSVAGRTEVVRVELTLAHDNPDQSMLFDADVTLRGTATVRTRED